MNDIDKQLKNALRRCDPSPGFAERVLSRIEMDSEQVVRPVHRPGWHWPILRWAAIPTLAGVLALGFGYQMYRHHKREEAEARIARQQLLLALRITGNKLRLAKQKVKEVEMGQGKPENRL
ncbi:MAG TPA: anti-sigma factor [Terriglobales bacterium]|nr:anti-sigma factor [Terriglobales bacterium]